MVPLVFKTSLGAVRSPEGSTPSLLRQSGAPRASPWHLPERAWGGILSEGPGHGRGSSRRVTLNIESLARFLFSHNHNFNTKTAPRTDRTRKVFGSESATNLPEPRVSNPHRPRTSGFTGERGGSPLRARATSSAALV